MPMDIEDTVRGNQMVIADLSARVTSLEAWTVKQNGSLQRMADTQSELKDAFILRTEKIQEQMAARDEKVFAKISEHQKAQLRWIISMLVLFLMLFAGVLTDIIMRLV